MIQTATKSLLVLAASGLMFVGAAAAQPQAGPGHVDPGHPRVNQVNGRETNQQKRIANGVKNGKLTPGQTAHLTVTVPSGTASQSSALIFVDSSASASSFNYWPIAVTAK